MKQWMVVAFVSMGVGLGVSHLSQAESQGVEPGLVNLLPEETVIPPNLQTKDNARIVMSGNLRNTCYRVASATAEVDKAGKRVYVSNQAFLYLDRFCLQMLVPYSQVVTLGNLPAGHYEILAFDDHRSTHLIGSMVISETVP